MPGPVAFGINGSFNIGQDVSVVWQHLESGVVIPASAFGHLMEFDASQEDTVLKIIPITDGGRPKLNTVYHGWRGHMMFTRFNGNLTGVLGTLEANFYKARQLSHWNFQATVLNRDGTTDQYLWVNGVVTAGTQGNWRSDKEVDMRVEFQAESMQVTGGVGVLIPLL